ncbi:hypothetical protein [Spirosoma jeollabukense]
MTSADKKQQAQSIAEEGKLLVNKAEMLLQKVVLRNARLSQEIKLTRLELEEKLGQQQQ